MPKQPPQPLTYLDARDTAARRRALQQRSLRRAIGAAVALHLVLLAAFVRLPWFAGKQPERLIDIVLQKVKLEPLKKFVAAITAPPKPQPAPKAPTSKSFTRVVLAPTPTPVPQKAAPTPTAVPTVPPTAAPTARPQPTSKPTVAAQPTAQPTAAPTPAPTPAPHHPQLARRPEVENPVREPDAPPMRPTMALENKTRRTRAEVAGSEGAPAGSATSKQRTRFNSHAGAGPAAVAAGGGGTPEAPRPSPGLKGSRLAANETAGDDHFGGGSSLRLDSGGGSARTRGNDIALDGGAGSVSLPRARARLGRGGDGGQFIPGVASAGRPELLASGPGSGSRGAAGVGDFGGDSFGPRSGAGLNIGFGGALGTGGRGRGSGEIAGTGGSGDGGNGSGGRRRTRFAGGPGDGFGGVPSAGKSGGSGGGSGGGNGPGPGTRYALRGLGDDGGGGDGYGSGPVGLGRGLGGDGNSDGRGTGRGRNGSSGRATAATGSADDAGLGGRGGKSRFKLARDEEQLLGRGLYPDGLQGEYFQDPDLSDRNYQFEDKLGRKVDWSTFTNKKYSRLDTSIDFHWNETPPAPGMTAVFWSARWKGKIFVPKDDDYTFILEDLDDAGRLYIDGNLMINVWRVQRSSPSSKVVHLTRGAHDLQIEYVQGPMTAASIVFKWKSSSFREELVGPYRSGGTRHAG